MYAGFGGEFQCDPQLFGFNMVGARLGLQLSAQAARQTPLGDA